MGKVVFMRVPRRFVVVLLLAMVALGVVTSLNRDKVDAVSSDVIATQGDDVVLEKDEPSSLTNPVPRVVPLPTILAGLQPLPEPRAADEAEALAEALLDSDLLKSMLPGGSPYSFDTYHSPLGSGDCLLCGMEGDGGRDPLQSAFLAGGTGFMLLGGGFAGRGVSSSGGNVSESGQFTGVDGLGTANAVGGTGGEGSEGGTGSTSETVPSSQAGPSSQGGPSSNDGGDSDRDPLPDIIHVGWPPEPDPAVPAPVPEPATIVLTGTGIAAFLAARRRQRR
jgi:hypothetical protein